MFECEKKVTFEIFFISILLLVLWFCFEVGVGRKNFFNAFTMVSFLRFFYVLR